MAESQTIRIVGIGNDFRSDDAVGLHVARSLIDMNIPGVEIFDGIAEGTVLLDIWRDCDRCFVIDCACSGRLAGTVFRFVVETDDIPSDIFTGYSTHNISVADAVELGKALGNLPRSLIVYGIEGKIFMAGRGLTEEVSAAAGDVVKRICSEIMDSEKIRRR